MYHTYHSRMRQFKTAWNIELGFAIHRIDPLWVDFLGRRVHSPKYIVNPYHHNSSCIYLQLISINHTVYHYISLHNITYHIISLHVVTHGHISLHVFTYHYISYFLTLSIFKPPCTSPASNSQRLSFAPHDQSLDQLQLSLRHTC